MATLQLLKSGVPCGPLILSTTCLLATSSPAGEKINCHACGGGLSERKLNAKPWVPHLTQV